MKRVEKALLLIFTLHFVSMILHLQVQRFCNSIKNILFLFLFLDFGFRDFNEGCHFIVMVDVST
jgi:hypothetical protein